MPNAYTSLSAKSKVMYRHRLNASDYEELIKKRSVSDIVAYLKQQPGYAKLLENVNETQIHRAQLEKLLKKKTFDASKKFQFFAWDGVEHYLKLLNVKNEVKILKLVARYFNTHTPSTLMPDIEFYKDAVLYLDVDKIMGVKSYGELCESVKGTPYEKILSRFAAAGEQLDLFSIETELDGFYLSLMWHQKDKLLHGADLKDVTHSLGTEIDLVNIMSTLRAKTYYQQTQELLYALIIPYHYHLRREALVALVDAKSADEALSLVAQTRYAPVFESSSPTQWEKNVADYLYRLYLADLKRTDSIGCILSYLHLTEIEVANIIALTEGVRYELAPEEIKTYLVGV